MRHSAIKPAIFTSLLVTVSMGCEQGGPYEEETLGILSEAKNAQDETSCDFDSVPLTVGNTHTVTIKNKKLKPLKEKDLSKKGYLVKIEIDGDVDSFDAMVENKETLVVSLRPDKTGPGTVSVFEVDKKKGKEKIAALCAFEVAESLEDTEGDTEGDADSFADSDADSDVEDQCPSDPDKTEPGVCGCGVADTDNDQDATPDCQDGCPNDASKIEPGECGCGVPEGTCGEDDDDQGDGCREGVIDDSRGGSDSRPACSQAYPWPKGDVDNWRNRCSLCSDGPYDPWDPNNPEKIAWQNYAKRSIGSPVTSCSNALLDVGRFHRTSQECSDFQELYGGVCCGREPVCAQVAVWYKDSPDLSCDDASDNRSCRCADCLTAPGSPNREIVIPVYDFSAISPFAKAVRNKDICGVELGTHPTFQTGQYETTCARLYEAARRGFTQTYECGYIENMLRDSCNSLPITP